MLYLVYRHGSNATNQRMCQTKPLCLVEAKSAGEARSIAEQYHTFYSNQFSVAVPSGRRRKDTNTVIDSVDNNVYRNNRDVIKHPQVIATVEPQIAY